MQAYGSSTCHPPYMQHTYMSHQLAFHCCVCVCVVRFTETHRRQKCSQPKKEARFPSGERWRTHWGGEHLSPPQCYTLSSFTECLPSISFKELVRGVFSLTVLLSSFYHFLFSQCPSTETWEISSSLSSLPYLCVSLTPSFLCLFLTSAISFLPQYHHPPANRTLSIPTTSNLTLFCYIFLMQSSLSPIWFFSFLHQISSSPLSHRHSAHPVLSASNPVSILPGTWWGVF